MTSGGSSKKKLMKKAAQFAKKEIAQKVGHRLENRNINTTNRYGNHNINNYNRLENSNINNRFGNHSVEDTATKIGKKLMKKAAQFAKKKMNNQHYGGDLDIDESVDMIIEYESQEPSAPPQERPRLARTHRHVPESNDDTGAELVRTSAARRQPTGNGNGNGNGNRNGNGNGNRNGNRNRLGRTASSQQRLIRQRSRNIDNERAQKRRNLPPSGGKSRRKSVRKSRRKSRRKSTRRKSTRRKSTRRKSKRKSKKKK